jgi:hypothetical protein
MSFPKQKDLSLYRGDTTKYIFNVSDLIGYVSVGIRFAVKRTDNNEKVIDFNILPTDPGNNWNAGIVQANVTSGMTQAIKTTQTLVLRYDLEVTRDDGSNPIVIKTEWYGTIAFTPDVTVGNPIITPPTEANIREDLGSNNISKGATLVGVASSIWTGIAVNVQEALEWLLDNTVGLPPSWVPGRILKTGASKPNLEYSGLEIDNLNNLTGANSVTADSAPTNPEDLTRKDYVDSEILSGIATRVAKTGDSMSGDLDMGGNIITGLDDGVSPSDAVNKAQLDNAVASVGVTDSPNWSSPSTTLAPSVRAVDERIGDRLSGESITIELDDDDEIKVTELFDTASNGEYLIFQESDPLIYARFMFRSGSPDSAVVLDGSPEVVTSDVDTKLCLYESSGEIFFKNRLGSTLEFRVHRRSL